MKKKIAFISEHASPLALLGGVDNGGQNVYVAELARELAKSGHIVDVYTRKYEADQPEEVNWLPGIRVIHIKAGPAMFIEKENLLQYMHEFADNMLDFINRERVYYDLVHANFFMSGLVASIIKKVLRIPYVITFHALGLVRRAHQKEHDRFPEERISIEKYIIEEADRVVAECSQDKHDLMSYYHADAAKIAVVPCGFNPAEFYPIDKGMARKKLGFSKDEKILLQLGRLVPRKGIDNVIRAVARLRNAIDPLRLVVVGGETDEPDPLLTPELGRLQQIAKEEQVSDKVLFTGRKRREQLKFYYAAADVFITTPWYEPFGITPLEAMACGVPVIGANVGGIKYSVLHGKTGFLVPPNDPAALAGSISDLLANSRLLEKMKANALKRVHKYFTWSCIANSMSRLYDTVLSETQHAMSFNGRIWLKENFSIKAIRNLLPESFYAVLSVQYEKSCVPG
jgi:D-inositol-3-phosphate glycosyltransferase